MNQSNAPGAQFRMQNQRTLRQPSGLGSVMGYGQGGFRPQGFGGYNPVANQTTAGANQQQTQQPQTTGQTPTTPQAPTTPPPWWQTQQPQLNFGGQPITMPQNMPSILGAPQAPPANNPQVAQYNQIMQNPQQQGLLGLLGFDWFNGGLGR